MNGSQRRMEVFKEIARLTFNNQLKERIDQVPYMFEESPGGITAVKNEVLVAMGLNPTAHADIELSREVDAALNLDEIELPLVTVNKSICSECNQEDRRECQNSCTYDRDFETSGLHPIIENGKCLSCGKCIPRCPLGAINDKIEFIPMSKYLEKGVPVYAAVAPAIAGQFGRDVSRDVSMGKLRSALKSIGFADMVEVALFADMVTLKEADEFNMLVKTKDDFLITSCCCPIWVNLLTKHYGKLYERLTKTVSPMIASGRIIKAIFPDSKTVFIGPCVAKKAEAKHSDLKGAIDYVLTFNELSEVFKALEIDLKSLPDDNKEQSSYGGRTYARTGGVSQAVETTLERIAPGRTVKFKAIQADGVGECKKLLDSIKSGKVEANFIEGMGCKGGCVGGPRANMEPEEGKRCVEEYGHKAPFADPIDNINVRQLLKYLESLEKEQFDRLLLRQ
jgi:iron only hydrogenase large subunit-like protein